MTWEEFQKTREYIEKKALALMSHENKDAAKTGFPIDNYREYRIDDRLFYCIQSNVFKTIVENHYLKAHQIYPDNFGTGEAVDILKALYLIEPVFEFDRYIDFLRDEQFAYLIEMKDGEVVDKVLRIDLFRKLEYKSKNQMEFTGGIFHALKHFSISGRNLATNKDIHDISHLESVLHMATCAFFIENGFFEDPKTLVTKIELDEKNNLKFVFYLEEITGVYFIKTIYKESK